MPAQPTSQPPVRAYEIPVVLAVYGTDLADAQQRLMARLPNCADIIDPDIDSWWIACDERIDGSDNPSVVYVPRGACAQARARIEDLWDAREPIAAAHPEGTDA